MTKLLQMGIEAVQALSPERQDLAGEILLSLANERRSRLTPEQIEDVKIGMAEAARGEFATDEEMEETWAKFEK